MTFIDKLVQHQFGYAFLLSAASYPVVEFIETYIFKDWHFAMFLMIVVGIDTVLGFAKHFISHSLSHEGFGRLFTKILIYGSVLILTHVLISYTVRSEVNKIFTWFDTVMYGTIMLNEAISILQNIKAIRPDILPSWILKRLQDFKKEGKLNRDQ